MSFQDDFNLFIGAKYGIFKGVKAVEGQPLIEKNIQSFKHLSKDVDITALSWSSDDEEEILIGLSNQYVKTYDTNGKVFSFSTDARIYKEPDVDAGDDNMPSEPSKKTLTELCVSKGGICGLSRYDGALVTAADSGHVKVMRYREEECVNIFADGPISRMHHSKSHRNIIGTGGLENELKLWDLNTGKPTFIAKNVPHDSLELRVKVWVTDHVFLPDSEKVVAGSRYGYVRLYDPKTRQRRPVINVDMPDKAVTCMAATSQDHTVLCGLAKGDIAAVDLRVGKTAQHYKGFVGSVRDIACHPSEPYIVSVGLDRFIRIHHLKTKELLFKEYVVSRMNCVLMRSNFNFKASHPVEVKKGKKRGASKDFLNVGKLDDAAQQLDEIFDTMEEVMDKTPKQSKKIPVLAEEKDSVSPSKAKKANLLPNPFAKESKKSTKIKNFSTQKISIKSPVKSEEDSDDDLVILSETLGNNATAVVHQESNSEVDEADGESDELEDDSEEKSDNDEEAFQ